MMRHVCPAHRTRDENSLLRLARVGRGPPKPPAPCAKKSGQEIYDRPRSPELARHGRRRRCATLSAPVPFFWDQHWLRIEEFGLILEQTLVVFGASLSLSGVRADALSARKRAMTVGVIIAIASPSIASASASREGLHVPAQSDCDWHTEVLHMTAPGGTRTP